MYLQIVVNFIYFDNIIVRLFNEEVSRKPFQRLFITKQIGNHGGSRFWKSCVSQMEDQSLHGTISQAVINICIPVKLVIRSRAAEQGE